MKHNRKFLFGLLAFTFLLSACTSKPQQIVDTEIPKQVIEKARNATVLIIDGNAEGNSGNGSGFFVAPDKIVTCIHVVADAKIVFAVGRKKVYNIEKVIGYDPKYDLVILKVSGEGNPLPLGEAKIDDPIFAVGYPDGGYDRIEGTVHGIRKSDNKLRLTFRGFPANSLVGGNSGGPILNDKGEVIGVATGANSGFGFASPSSVLQTLLNSSGSDELSLSDWQKKNSIRAWAYTSRAQKKRESEDYDPAIRYLDKVIGELYPDFPGAHQQRGIAKTELGELEANLGDLKKARSLYQAASEDYRVAIEQNPDSAFPFLHMGRMKILRGEDGDYKTAIENLNTAIRLNPNLAIAYSHLGRAKHKSGDHDGAIKAIEAYERAIKQNSNDANAYLNLGNLKQEISDYAGAIEAFNKIIHLNSKLVVEATFNMGNAKLESKDYDGAIEAYNKVIESKLVHLHPQAYYKRGLAKEASTFSKTKDADMDKIIGYFHWGVNHYRSKQHQLAIDNFNKFLDLKKDYAESYYQRGLAYFALKQYQKAIEDYTAAITLKSDYAESYYQRGFTYSVLEQYQKAIEDYTAAITLKSDYAESYYQRGFTYSVLEQYQKAIEDYTAAIERKHDYAEAYHSRGVARKILKQDDIAKSDFAMALLIRGIANWNEEQYKQAIDKFDEVIGLIPNFAAAYNNRGLAKRDFARAKADQGDLEEARQLYQEALEDFNKFNKLNPKELLAYHQNSGYTQYARGNDFNDDGGYKASIEHYDEVIRIEPNSATSHLNKGRAQCLLGYSEAHQGNSEEAQKLYNSAIKDLNKVLKLHPEDARAYYYWIGLANAGLGKAKKAIAALEKAKVLNVAQGN